MKIIKSFIGLFILLLVLSVSAGNESIPDEITIDITVAPNVLNLNNQGEVVTVHTDIAFSAVIGSTVFLNGIEINSWKSDDRGNFVAKFLMSEVKKLTMNIGELNTLTLVGKMLEDGEFTGSTQIKVIQVIPTGSGKK